MSFFKKKILLSHLLILVFVCLKGRSTWQVSCSALHPEKKPPNQEGDFSLPQLFIQSQRPGP